MLGNLFKPRWQHRDAALRAQAIAALDAAGDAPVIQRIAREDPAAAVRCAACEKLRDFAALDGIIQNDPETSVRDAASARFMALLAGTAMDAPELKTRLELIRRTDNPAVLEHIAQHGADAESRRIALAAIDDASQLFNLALSGHDEALRVSAAERLDDATLLRRLSREGRDKRVIQHARERVKAFQREESEAQQRREHLDQVVAALEHLAQTHSEPLFEARLQQQEQHWAELADSADTDHRQRAEQALALCHARQAQRAEEEAREQRLRDAEQQRRAALATLEALFDDCDEQTWDDQLGTVRSVIETQQRRWQAGAEEQSIAASESQRFERVLARWQWLIGLAEQALQASPERLAELAREWPGALPAPTALRTARLAEQARIDEQPSPAPKAGKDKARPSSPHRGLVTALRRELQQGNLKHANRLWHKAESLLAEQNDAWLVQQMERLSERRDELRDWHAFAAEPKKEQLCRKMESLIGIDLDAAELASAIQALHDEWRSLMSSDQDQDQALWDRFKGASDQAYQPCRQHFAELDVQRAENLALRRQLCEQLATFVKNENWAQADWQAVWEIRRAAPQEWRRYSPVRFTDARDLQKRFSAQLSAIDERLEQAWQQAEAERQRLIDAATALVESGEEAGDTHAAAHQARELQQQWRAAPWLPPARHRGLHKRFRRLIDNVFTAREVANQARHEEQQEVRQQAQDSLAKLAQQADKPLREQDKAALTQAINDLDDIKQVLDRDGQRRADTLLARLRQLRTGLPRWQGWHASLNRLEQSPPGAASAEDATLAVALEVLAGVESPESAREQRMAWQLEQLPRMMKTSRFEPLEEALALVAKRPAEQPLEMQLQERIVKALRALEPLPG